MTDPDTEPYRTLPERVAPEDLVEETDVSVSPAEPTGDPNRETAVRIGLIGDAG